GHHRAQARLEGRGLGSVMSLLNERAELCRILIEEGSVAGLDPAMLEAARAEALRRAETIRDLLESPWVQV
ncbi:hypothetical protein, partial [Methylobacterium oxalidis]|uniref:hypothetical protein n=1 Tax=Methylobacterium oxalidis TaxID=944322 RepID=UPI001EDEAE94